MIDSKVLEEINKENIITNKYIKEISNKYKICSSFIVGRLAKLNKIKYNSKLYNDNIERISF